MDSALERLMQGLYDRSLLHCVNIIVLSDHGMTDVHCDQNVAILPILKANLASYGFSPKDVKITPVSFKTLFFRVESVIQWKQDNKTVSAKQFLLMQQTIQKSFLAQIS